MFSLVDNHGLRSRVDDEAAMYNAIRYKRPASGSPSSSHSPADVTPPTPPSPPEPSQDFPFNPSISNEADYDYIHSHIDLGDGYLCHIRNPLALRRRANSMAEDFSEGRLETLVGSPQKELSGTQNQYVSYLITTKVGPQHDSKGLQASARLACLHSRYSPIISPSRNPSSPCAAASQTSSSCGNNFAKNTHNALFHHCPINTRWSMCAETVSAQTLPRGARTHYTAS